MHVIIFPENETHRAPCIVEIALFFWFHLYVVFLHFKKKKKKNGGEGGRWAAGRKSMFSYWKIYFITAAVACPFSVSVSQICLLL